MATRRMVRVLVATQAEEVYQILGSHENVQYDIALYTGTIKDLLPQVQLIIIDYEQLVAYPLSETEIRELILGADIPQCTSQDFINNPDRFLGELVMNRAGNMLSLPERYCLAYVSYSGGTGRSTLALDTALCFAKHMQKSRPRTGNVPGPAAGSALLVEMTLGVSSVVSLCGIEMPRLYQLATDTDTLPHQFRGVDMAPMDYENVRVLSSEFVQRYFSRRVKEYQLTVVDCSWPHGLSDAIASMVDLWIVVASKRPDTISNAHRLEEELQRQYGEEKVWLLQNMVDGGKKGEDGGSLNWHIRLPRISSPDEYRGQLGQAVLGKVFAPLWQEPGR
jgi:hypothetical protein